MLPDDAHPRRWETSSRSEAQHWTGVGVLMRVKAVCAPPVQMQGAGVELVAGQRLASSAAFLHPGLVQLRHMLVLN